MDKHIKMGKGVKFERIRRITGYLQILSRWNDAKKAEEKDRVKHGVGEVTAESAIKSLHDAALRVSADDYDKLKPMFLLSTMEEIYPDCTVQVLTNTATGDVSVGRWKNETD